MDATNEAKLAPRRGHGLFDDGRVLAAFDGALKATGCAEKFGRADVSGGALQCVGDQRRAFGVIPAQTIPDLIDVVFVKLGETPDEPLVGVDMAVHPPDAFRDIQAFDRRKPIGLARRFGRRGGVATVAFGQPTRQRRIELDGIDRLGRRNRSSPPPGRRAGPR